MLDTLIASHIQQSAFFLVSGQMRRTREQKPGCSSLLHSFFSACIMQLLLYGMGEMLMLTREAFQQKIDDGVRILFGAIGFNL